MTRTTLLATAAVSLFGFMPATVQAETVTLDWTDGYEGPVRSSDVVTVTGNTGNQVWDDGPFRSIGIDHEDPGLGLCGDAPYSAPFTKRVSNAPFAPRVNDCRRDGTDGLSKGEFLDFAFDRAYNITEVRMNYTPLDFIERRGADHIGFDGLAAFQVNGGDEFELNFEGGVWQGELANVDNLTVHGFNFDGNNEASGYVGGFVMNVAETVAPVPLPGGAWGLMAGLAAFGGLGSYRKRKSS